MNEDQLDKLLTPEDKEEMIVPKRKLGKMLKVGGTICVITVLIILISAFATGGRIATSFVGVVNLSQGDSLLAPSGSVTYNKLRKSLTFTDTVLSQDYLVINANYEQINSEHKLVSECRTNSNDDPDSDLPSNCTPQLKLDFQNDIHADIYDIDLDGMQCHDVMWYSANTSQEITNCFTLEDNWYGGGGLSIHRWPLDRVNVPLQPHITRKLQSYSSSESASFDSFIEPYFVSADGVAILLEHNLPLFISVNQNNDKKLCFMSAFKYPYASLSLDDKLSLKYLVCKEQTAKSVHQRLLKASKIQFYSEHPQDHILRKPIWSTRGLDITGINQRKVISFVDKIKSNKLLHGQLFIDGNYSKSRGNYYFNERTFSHSHQYIMELLSSPEEMTLPVGIEVFPYTPTEKSKLFAIQYKDDSVVKQGQNEPYFVDVTNVDAVEWYKSHLKELTEQINIKGFRLSGAYAADIIKYVNPPFLITNMTLHNPNEFTTKLAEIVAEVEGTILLGSGYKSQRHTFVADAGPMVSSWEHNKGLKSIIPTVLTYGIMGYPFGLLGPVGGVNLGDISVPDQIKPPNKELYIRWLQLMTYLPVMELSFGPWMYDEEVVNYTQSLLNFRYSMLWSKSLSSAVTEAVNQGTPIARPLWWVAPHDKIAQHIDCEFILGNSLLVAPVLYSDARNRDVYLPQGSYWKDLLHGKIYKGGQWLRKYSVDLYEIATFNREVKPPRKT